MPESLQGPPEDIFELEFVGTIDDHSPTSHKRAEYKSTTTGVRFIVTEQQYYSPFRLVYSYLVHPEDFYALKKHIVAGQFDRMTLYDLAQHAIELKMAAEAILICNALIANADQYSLRAIVLLVSLVEDDRKIERELELLHELLDRSGSIEFALDIKLRILKVYYQNALYSDAVSYFEIWALEFELNGGTWWLQSCVEVGKQAEVDRILELLESHESHKLSNGIKILLGQLLSESQEPVKKLDRVAAIISKRQDADLFLLLGWACAELLLSMPESMGLEVITRLGGRVAKENPFYMAEKNTTACPQTFLLEMLRWSKSVFALGTTAFMTQLAKTLARLGPLDERAITLQLSDYAKRNAPLPLGFL